MVKNHIAYELSGHIRRNESIKWMCRAECIPKTEGTMIYLTFRHLLDLIVGGHVAAVYVTHSVRLHENMVESCVENGFLLVCTFNVNACQFLLPSIVRCLHIVVEIPVGGLCLHIETCTFAVNRRYCHLYSKFLTFVRIK